MSSVKKSQPAVFHHRPRQVEAMQVAKPYNKVADWAGATIIRENGNSVAWLQVSGTGAGSRALPGDWIVREAHGQIKVVYQEDFQRMYESADRLVELEQAIGKVRHEATTLTEQDNDYFYMNAIPPAEVGRELLALLPKD